MKKSNKNNLEPTKSSVSQLSEGERAYYEFLEEDRLFREEKGREFQKARESAELTRNAMARLAGISWSTLKRFETGKNILRTQLVEKSLTNALEMERLRRVFGVLVGQLPYALRNLESKKPWFL